MIRPGELAVNGRRELAEDAPSDFRTTGCRGSIRGTADGSELAGRSRASGLAHPKPSTYDRRLERRQGRKQPRGILVTHEPIVRGTA